MNLTGLIGKPVTHSIGQAVYNRYYEKSGLDSIYISVDLANENLAKFVEMARKKFLGYNVTIPHKVRIIEYLDRVDGKASEIGAVNLVRNRDGKSEGFNTDYLAMQRLSSSSDINFRDAEIAVRGVGGVARAVINFISTNFSSSRITLVTRDPATVSERLPKNMGNADFQVVRPEEMDRSRFDVLINCSPLGMYPETGSSPFEVSVIEKCMAGIDLVYNPRETKFIELLKQHGKQAVDGVGFFTDQGYESMTLLFGDVIDRNMLEGIVDEVVRGSLGRA